MEEILILTWSLGPLLLFISILLSLRSRLIVCGSWFRHLKLRSFLSFFKD